jgi:hypothetical protein
MPKRIVKTPVQVNRDGKLVFPPVGSAFDFTDEEVKSINKLNPKAIGYLQVVEVEAAKVELVKAKADAKVTVG